MSSLSTISIWGPRNPGYMKMHSSGTDLVRSSRWRLTARLWSASKSHGSHRPHNSSLTLAEHSLRATYHATRCRYHLTASSQQSWKSVHYYSNRLAEWCWFPFLRGVIPSHMATKWQGQDWHPLSLGNPITSYLTFYMFPSPLQA